MRIQINLLPVREARRRADLTQQVMLLGLLVGLVILAAGYFQYSVRSSVKEGRRRVAETQQEIKKFDAQLKQIEAYKKKKADVQKKLDVIAGLARSRSGPVHVLDELAMRTPERLWITEFEAQGKRLTLKGLSLDNEIVALFLTQLSESEYFGGVELEKTELQTTGGLKLHRFQVRAVRRDPLAEAEQGKDPNRTGRPRASAGGAAVGR